MKKSLLVIFCFVFISNLYSQNNWNLVWSLHQQPFQELQEESGMAIVKAGFDTDEDGWGEFLCAYTDLDFDYILMYEASADNTYDLVWYWKYPVVANSFAGIAVGDLDNNGIVEIITTLPADVTVESNPPRLWVFEWNGVQGENKYGLYDTGISEPMNEWNFDVADNTDLRPYSLTIEDIDFDGDNELIVGVRLGDRGREVIVASVTGTFSTLAAWNIEYNLQGLSGGSLYSVTTGDLDSDGNREIYAMVWNNFKLRIIECTGPGQYQVVTAIDELYANEGIDYGALDGIRVADVNDDGVNELYIAGTEPENTVFMITNITDVSTITENDVQEFFHIPVNSQGKLRSMYVADPDQDGKADLMIAGERNGQIFDLEYKGAGDPSDAGNWELTVAFDIFTYSGISPDDANTITPRLFYGHPANDMDNDGLNEYVFVNWSSDFGEWAGDGYVWLIEADQTTGVSVSDLAIPENYVLKQNYPNPFNPSTLIQYEIPEKTTLSLKIYNMLGMEVKTLFQGSASPGKYSFIWHGRDENGNVVPSGTYIYRLETDQHTFSKSMSFVK